MAYDYDLPNATDAFTLLAANAVGTNVDGTGVDLSNYQGVVGVYIQTGLPTNQAASPKINYVVQDSADNTTYADVTGKSANLTNTANLAQLAVDTRAINRYMRVRVNIAGGNSPNWPVSVTGLAVLKYNPS